MIENDQIKILGNSIQVSAIDEFDAVHNQENSKAFLNTLGQEWFSPEKMAEIAAFTMRDQMIQDLSWAFDTDELDKILDTPGLETIPPEMITYVYELQLMSNVADIVSYFSIPEKPLNGPEFFDFWFSLSIYERMFWKVVRLK